MTAVPRDERYTVVGLARVRASWFAEVAGWANSAQLPIDFLKCVTVDEVRARVAAARPMSALLVDSGVAGVDRYLVETIRSRGTAVLVVDGGPDDRTRIDLGASATLPPTFGRTDLLDALRTHAPESDADVTATRIEPDDPGSERSAWRGRLVTVTGGSGTGCSTIAMALAQGMAALPGNEGSVVLADASRNGDLAMYHDTRDVVPGIQELVEAHRSGPPTRGAVRECLYAAEDRGYSLLLGLRRSRDWTTLRPRPLHAAFESLRSTFRMVIADADPEVDGEAETGSPDSEVRNAPARVTALNADLVLVCGDPTLKGMRAIATVTRDLADVGVPTSRMLLVVNRAPRSPRARAELTAALGELCGDGHRVAPLFVPDRRHLDLDHRVPRPLPAALVQPVTRAVASAIA